MNAIKKITAFCLILTSLSCSNNSDKSKPRNALLWDRVIVNDIFGLYEGDENHPLMIRNDSSFAILKKSLNVVIQSISENKNKCYESYTDWNIFNAYSKEKDILNSVLKTCYMSRETGEIGCVTSGPIKSSNDFDAIQFTEEWFFDENNFRLTKNVISYTPVKYVFIKVLNKRGTLPHFKIKVSDFDENNEPVVDSKQVDSDYKLLIENVKPRIEVLENKNASGLDGKKFINIIIDKVLNEEVKIYDPLYLIDFEKRPFTLNKLYNYCGFSLDSIKNEKFKLIFVEDWYFNETNLKIKKKVKGFGLIRKEPYQILFYAPFKV